MYRLLLVAHAPSPNTRTMAEAVLRGARHADIENTQIRWVLPLPLFLIQYPIHCGGEIVGVDGGDV